MVSCVAECGFEFFQKSGRIGTTEQKAIHDFEQVERPVLLAVDVEIDQWLLAGEKEPCEALAMSWIAEQIALIFSPDIA